MERRKAAAVLGRIGGLKKSERKRVAVLANLTKANAAKVRNKKNLRAVGS